MFSKVGVKVFLGYYWIKTFFGLFVLLKFSVQEKKCSNLGKFPHIQARLVLMKNMDMWRDTQVFWCILITKHILVILYVIPLPHKTCLNILLKFLFWSSKFCSSVCFLFDPLPRMVNKNNFIPSSLLISVKTLLLIQKSEFHMSFR